MTVTDFLTKHARRYVSIDELWKVAKPDLLKPEETKEDFVRLLTAWMRKYRSGEMSNGKVFYTELPIGSRKKQMTVKMPSGKNVALILVADPMK